MKHLSGVLLTLIAAVLWGTVGIGVHQLQNTTSLLPEHIAFLRLGLAAPVLLIFCLKGPWMFTRQAFWPVVGIGLGHAVYCWAYFKAIPLSGVSIAVTVSLGTAPLLLALLGLVQRTLRPRMSLGLALLLGMLGLGFLTGLQVTPSGVQGILLSVLAGAGWALLIRSSEQIAHHQGQTLLIGMAFLVGSGFLLPVAPQPPQLTELPLSSWGILLYLAIAPSAVGYVLFQQGLKVITSVTAGLLSLFEPVVSILLAMLLFAERLQLLQWVGLALLLGMLVIITVKQQEKEVQVALPLD
ncbi:DMT family transporter [Deinococcus roseus]|uniref:EamA domain-containing protein n=1 Tax=Deinococcus roseus TaxID=392414 RepID=A0ABQ2D2C0_9DEIO|nr:EamA family transporter [Deinococcus roseus]GGJ42943.1 hypothetical protein GCM10008938_31410 [Deinococcus roseus]